MFMFQAYINRGDVLIKMGRPEEAKSVYETALTYDRQNADLHYNIGVVHIELGLVEQAQQDFTRALQVQKLLIN
jgi:tetratricopeptide (TPR) repeat protein